MRSVWLTGSFLAAKLGRQAIGARGGEQGHARQRANGGRFVARLSGLALDEGEASAETVYAVIGVVLGFYFGSSSTASVSRAVTRALGERGYKE